MKLALFSAAILLAVPAMAAPPVEVMVLGAYHFGNPGLDLNNVKVDSVLTPRRQAELERVAQAIGAFKPTHVMVEMQSVAPDLAIAEFTRFDDAMLAKDANEIVQIGYRIARNIGLRTVNGIDEQPKDGEPDYFPFDKVQDAAGKFGQTAQLAASNTAPAAAAKAFEADLATHSVGQMLTRMNTPRTAMTGMDSYYSILPIGDHDNQAGADLNAAWYLRNAKIFGKLMSLVKPGDRVLVVYGSGHGYWLRHFASETPGFRFVDPRPYLAKAQ